MKQTKLVPNANLSKEWERYMKCWQLHKKQKGKKKQIHRMREIQSPMLTKVEQFPQFSVQEIKNVAQRQSYFDIPCLNALKL